VTPHGDRRDRTESRGIKGKEMTALKRHHNIMRVLILRDDLHDSARRRLLTTPAEDIRQGSLLSKPCLGANKDGLRNGSDT
jgi:hypothetical protein